MQADDWYSLEDGRPGRIASRRDSRCADSAAGERSNAPKTTTHDEQDILDPAIVHTHTCIAVKLCTACGAPSFSYDAVTVSLLLSVMLHTWVGRINRHSGKTYLHVCIRIVDIPVHNFVRLIEKPSKSPHER